MADVELLPLPSEVRLAIRAYARACVEANLAALQAENERLRTIAGCAYQMAGVHDAPEIWLDRLSEAANGDPLPDPDTISDELLPYQPEAVCDAEIRARKLDAEIEALRAEVAEWKRVAAAQAELHGEAEEEVDRLRGYVREADRRVGEQFMAAQDADAHRLRVLHDRLLDVKRAEAAEARAERLAEALRGMMAEYEALHAEHDLGECQATVDARAALEQEEGRG